MPNSRVFPCLVLVALTALLGCGRKDEPERTTFYQRKIAPVLQGSCAQSPSFSSCHVARDDRGNVVGNLSVESYETLSFRRDLLVDYGPYAVPGLLLKAMPPFEIRLTSGDGSEPMTITTDIAHVGGSILDVTSASFTQLDEWIDNGAAENNAPPSAVSYDTSGECARSVGSDPLFDPSVEPTAADYAQFDRANRVLGKSCATTNCHGSASNSLYLTCGSTEEQKRWNYFAAGDYVAQATTFSEILRRGLDPAQGGTFHEGGVIFESSADEDYVALREWAEAKGGPTNIPQEPGFQFFEQRVLPMLVKRGCMMLGCHSATMFHDYRLRGGSAGHFSLPATRKNYELTLEQVALESPDPNASRLIRKNLPPPPDGVGILHRGGALFGSGGDPSQCDMEAASSGPIDEQDPYCVIAAWLGLERQERMSAATPLTGMVFVRRAPKPGNDAPQDWEAFSPGAEVVRVDMTRGEDGALTLGAETSLSALCGLDSASTDARRPAVSWDGARVAFSARSGENEPYRIYVVESDSCSVEPTIDQSPVDGSGNPVPTNGELIHNFDPAFAPDGRIVFVSTRGNIDNVAAFSYQGPQRTPADPSKLNTNLYVAEDSSVRQLTFLLNQELLPAFMSDGRVILSAEKRAPDFYQLAGRRINLDGGDYHPLFGQRPTIGHDQFSGVVELTDKNLAAIVSERGAQHGAGRLIIVNRSIGVDQRSADPADYVQNPAAISWPNQEFYQHSIKVFDDLATGLISETQGAYRDPSPLPDGRLLVSYAADVTDLSNFSGNFDIIVADPVTRSAELLLSDSNDLLFPVALYARQNHGVFTSRLDEANGATRVYADEGQRDHSEVTFEDVPLLMSLLFQNTRTGRILPEGASFDVWEALPPEQGVTSLSANDPNVFEDDFGLVYARRRYLGTPEIFLDGSAKMQVPGGLPITYSTMIQLAGDNAPAPHFLREEQQFYPGEVARQSFRRELFNGLCGGCHGSVSGLEYHVAANPDVLTQASSVVARDKPLPELLRPGRDPEPQPYR